MIWVARPPPLAAFFISFCCFHLLTLLGYPILSQIPLIVNPSFRAPHSITLPYNYKQLPSSVPESAVDAELLDQIIHDSTGFIDAIDKRHTSLKEAYKSWEDSFQQDLVLERRKIAPGYLDMDSDSRLLEPTRQEVKRDDEDKERKVSEGPAEPVSEIDQAFGGSDS